MRVAAHGLGDPSIGAERVLSRGSSGMQQA